MSDLVKRLRNDAVFDRLSGSRTEIGLSEAAADRIEQLERVLLQAREAITQLVACHDEPSCPAAKIGEHCICTIDEVLE